MKKLLIGILLIVIVGAGGVFYLSANAGALVRGAVVEYVPPIIGTDVELASVELDAVSGTASNLQFAFQNGMMFIAMKNSKNYFEGDGHRLDDPKYIESTTKELAFLFEIVRDLNLTQKTKI